MSCSGNTCSVTLGGNGTAAVLGTTLSLQGIDDGGARLLVGGQEVTCTAGQTVSVGPLTVRCSSVTSDTVDFTVTRR